MSSGGVSLKLCSCCGQERTESEYSGAQLKRKGKRVCKRCVEGTGAAAAAGGAAAQQQHQTAHAAAASPAAAAASATPSAPAAAASSVQIPRVSSNGAVADAAPAPTVAAAGAAAEPSEPVPPAPSNPHFPSQSPALWDASRGVAYYSYSSESQLPLLTALIEADLSEPYSVFTYRYFLNFWPHLTFMAMKGSSCIGCIVCRVTMDKRGNSRGYIAMLAVSPLHRGGGLGTRLVRLALDAMRMQGAALCILEAEVTNAGALALYDKLDFVRESRLVKYYLSGSDAFRLRLWLRPPQDDGDFAPDGGDDD